MPSPVALRPSLTTGLPLSEESIDPKQQEEGQSGNLRIRL